MNNSWILLGCLLVLGYSLSSANSAENGSARKIKVAGFTDPNTGYLYRVTSYNLTQLTTQSTHRSMIKVSRTKLSEKSRKPTGLPETIQTISFHPTLVDFDIHCLPTHCYLVAVTSRTKRNVELYAWERTQFDKKATRDSFARPHAVKIFRIQSGFYIAVAQEQVHLATFRLTQEYEEPTRFIGCAILKFVRGHEHNMKYHQFIRLPFNPWFVNYFYSTNSNNVTSMNMSPKSSVSHYLMFSVEPTWQESRSSQDFTFIWSPLNDQFWPFELPSGVEFGTKPGYQNPFVTFPSQQKALNLSIAKPRDQYAPIESCFIQLQSMLIDRDLYARKLIDSSKDLWQSPQAMQNNSLSIVAPGSMTNISAQVIVRGNVVVRGSLIQSPQLTLVGQGAPDIITAVNNHSPTIVENKLKQAFYKLQYIREKLSRAITSQTPSDFVSLFNSRVRFFGNILANHVRILGNGIANSNVRLNGIPFRQLEHELVSLSGSQDIAAKVVFEGNVVADLLEIHGLVNKFHYLKDAIDIRSRRIQVIDSIEKSPNYPNSVALEFRSVTAPELIISPNSTFNTIRLGDFITRDNRTQIIFGRKSFKNLFMGRLDLANPNVLVNGYNISRLATNSIHLQDPLNRKFQIVNGNHLTFSKPVQARRLTVNNIINRHINISSLIHDSVKTFDISQQQIFGYKHFLKGLKINQLTTDGSINGIQINQVFNLNPTPPVADYQRYQNSSLLPAPVLGKFIFNSPVTIVGHLNSDLINGIDISRRAIRRIPPSLALTANGSAPQMVYGTKIFTRNLRVINNLRMMNQNQSNIMNISQPVYPTINGLDMRLIQAGLMRQVKSPSIIYIDNLEIDGNLNLQSSWNNTGSQRSTFGNLSVCPLDIIKTKLISSGSEEQLIDVPVRISSLRAKSVLLEPGALNGMSFPADFILRSNFDHETLPQGDETPIQLVFGHKSFENIVVGPSFSIPFMGQRRNPFSSPQPYPQPEPAQSIVFGPRSSINNITYNELQTFIAFERQRNLTGETTYQTLNVYGSIRARKINGYHWPDDIILKSIGANGGFDINPSVHRRIYSPLIFTGSSNLEIVNQLVLRGPIQLEGRLNNVNLTEFSRQSVTYGDKDLLSMGRPLRNKLFVGGLTVTGQIRSQGLIDGINIDEMTRRVVTIRPAGRRTLIMNQKVFLSDINFLAPISMIYLNDIPIDRYLRPVEQNLYQGNLIRIRGKKTITGVLKINRNLIVQGLINRINFVDLKARAISLSPQSDEITFNKTLTIEGNVFMDNLLIDEKNGVLDGVKLTNLLPINPLATNELVISEPILTPMNRTQGYQLSIMGAIHDCKITCSLTLAQHYPMWKPQYVQNVYREPRSQSIHLQPANLYPKQQRQYNGDLAPMRTTPPYAMDHQFTPQPVQFARIVAPDQQKIIRSLARRIPTAIHYEGHNQMIKHNVPTYNSMALEHVRILRKKMISLNLFEHTTFKDLIVGYIEASPFNMASLQYHGDANAHPNHVMRVESFLQLHQIDFPFRPTTYHLRVGVSTNYNGQNITKVYTSVGGGDIRQLSVLPIEYPNSAMFLMEQSALFLFVSQDYTTFSNKNYGAQCPRQMNWQSTGISEYDYRQDHERTIGGVHVYLFHSLQNSSSLSSAYFDLYQTIDLPTIDNFEHFRYGGSTYVLAVSRTTNKVFLMLLRGYTGFQIVSYIDAPGLAFVKVAYLARRPMLVIHLTNGKYRLMESVLV